MDSVIHSQVHSALSDAIHPWAYSFLPRVRAYKLLPCVHARTREHTLTHKSGRGLFLGALDELDRDGHAPVRQVLIFLPARTMHGQAHAQEVSAAQAHRLGLASRAIVSGAMSGCLASGRGTQSMATSTRTHWQETVASISNSPLLRRLRFTPLSVQNAFGGFRDLEVFWKFVIFVLALVLELFAARIAQPAVREKRSTSIASPARASVSSTRSRVRPPGPAPSADRLVYFLVSGNLAQHGTPTSAAPAFEHTGCAARVHRYRRAPCRHAGVRARARACVVSHQ